MLVSITSILSPGHSYNENIIPEYLNLGVAFAAYQTEGAWNVDGKGPSIWDNYTHRVPSPIKGGTTGDIACDFYHKYEEDIARAAYLGVKLFRFSLSWTRILPNGYDTEINEKGIEHYKNVIREIKKYNMTPVATIYHWDLPQKLVDDGIDWTNPKLVDIIVNYARIVIGSFPDVGIWTTINEPGSVCHFGYGSGFLAPGIHSSGLKEYQCAYVILKAHAGIYHMYKEEFKEYKAKMAAIIDCPWIESLTNSTEDEIAADRQRQFTCGLYFHPIFVGDWPDVVKTRVAEKSRAANLSRSRLPEFTLAEKESIKGSHDFIGLNYYYTFLADDSWEDLSNGTSYENDVGVKDSFNPYWVVEMDRVSAIVPSGIRKMLNWLKQQYGDHEIVITELGLSENGTSLDDDIRIDFYNDYICNVLAAINEDEVNVTGVIAWCLIDDFEWTWGYEIRYGFYHVDFTDTERPRRPKKSVNFFKSLNEDRQLSCDKPSRKWFAPRQWHDFRNSNRGNLQ